MHQRLNKFKLPQNFRGRNPIAVQFWWIFQSIVIGLSPQFMYGWRCFWLRVFGAKVGHNVLLRPSVRVTYPWRVAIGDDTWVGDNVELYSLGRITIGSNVVLSQNAYLCTGTHDHSSPTFDMITAPIDIEDEVWIASDVFVYPGVSVGFGCVVGARSTVTGNLPAEMICIGSPCKPLKKRIQTSARDFMSPEL